MKEVAQPGGWTETAKSVNTRYKLWLDYMASDRSKEAAQAFRNRCETEGCL